MSRYAIANGIRRYFGSKSLIAINEFLYVVKYRWNKMPIDENIREVKQDKNHATSVVWVSVPLIKGAYEDKGGIPGYRQMTIKLNRENGFNLNNKRIYRLMRILNLKSVCRKKKKSYIKSTPQNGPMETFWGMLKSEMYYLKKFNSYDELKNAVIYYIEYYNNGHYQKRLNCMTPLEFREYLQHKVA